MWSRRFFLRFISMPQIMENIAPGLVLIVDDTRTNVDILVDALREECRLAVARSGEKALEIARRDSPDLILLDVRMPGLDGYAVCAELKRDERTRDIPVIFITALNEIADKAKGFELGAVDYIPKPFEILEVKARVRTQLSLCAAMRALKDQNRLLEVKVRERTREIKDTQLEIVSRLARAAEYRDGTTGLHIVRMSRYCAALAEAAGFSEDRCELIQHASTLHDVGKIGIPDYILLKPGRLTPQEREIIKTHTTIGAELLAGHSSELMETARAICLTHHERWDGEGYPRGLRGPEIPIEGRICCLCDVFDALTSQRPYKTAWPVEEALEEIRRGRDKAFDPRLADLFMEISPTILAIKELFSI